MRIALNAPHLARTRSLIAQVHRHVIGDLGRFADRIGRVLLVVRPPVAPEVGDVTRCDIRVELLQGQVVEADAHDPSWLGALTKAVAYAARNVRTAILAQRHQAKEQADRMRADSRHHHRRSAS